MEKGPEIRYMEY